jgi:hypothetical protein
MLQEVTRDELRAVEDNFQSRLMETRDIAIEARMNGVNHEQICAIRYGNINAGMALQAEATKQIAASIEAMKQSAWKTALDIIAKLAVAAAALTLLLMKVGP